VAIRKAVVQTLLVATAVGAAAQDRPATEKPVKSINQSYPITKWIARGGPMQHAVAEGPLIQIGEGPGWLHSHHSFDNFVLELEFRIVQPGTQSGVFVRAARGDRPSTGYRIALSDTTAGQDAVGRVDLRGYQSSNLRFEEARLPAVARALGEWQALTIVCENARLQVALNGESIAVADDLTRATGVIGIEGLKGRTEIRNIQARRMGQQAFTSDPAHGLYRAGEGVAHPKLVREAKPSYSRGAMKRMVQGVVYLEAIIRPDGNVGDVRVIGSLDSELDEEAVRTVKRWKFSPATLEGKPVSAIVEVEMSFTLR
jgi:TonB family protein